MCLQTIVKYLLFLFNFVFWLGGLALIVLGILVLVNLSEVLSLLPVNLSAIPISIIVAGSVVFIISFSGCCGAIKESRCLLILYAIFMLILASSKAYLAYLVFAFMNNLSATVQGWIEEAFEAHKNDTNTPFGILELAFQCCGTTGADSYVASNLMVPPTCCPQPSETELDVCTLESSYGGCSARFGDYLQSNASAVGGIIIAIIIVELLAMTAALYINSAITKKKRSNKFY